MDAIKRYYKVGKTFYVQNRPNYEHQVCRSDMAPVQDGSECKFCEHRGVVAYFGPAAISAKGHQYQPCSSGTHQLFWNERVPVITLPGRPSPTKLIRDPHATGCRSDGCKGRVAGACGSFSCLKHCLDRAQEEYNDNKNPLRMCTAHRTHIEDLVQGLIEAGEAPAGGPADNYTVSPEVSDNDEPYVPIAPPAPPANSNRNARPGTSNANRPQATPAPAPRRRGVLAMPVAPLPAGLVVGNRPLVLNGDHRVQRQQAINSLSRLAKEDGALALKRRIKITMWTSPTSQCRTEVVTNSKSSGDAVIFSQHPSIIEHLSNQDTGSFAVEVYDRKSKEWLRSGPDVPHPLGGHDRLLVRLPFITPAECAGLDTYLAETTPDTSTTHKRKLSVFLHDDKGKGILRTIKKEPVASTSRPPLQHPPSSLESDPEPPSSPLLRKRPRVLNPERLSWIMRQPYHVISCCLEQVPKLQASGYRLRKAINKAFNNTSVTRSTWQRHHRCYQNTPDDLKFTWATEHADRLWVEFWQEHNNGSEADIEESRHSSEGSSDDDDDEEIKGDTDIKVKLEPSTQPMATLNPRPPCSSTGSVIELSDSSSDSAPKPGRPIKAKLPIKAKTVEIIVLSD
ncbi:hypothetical protein M408DRAFT_26929 [Serendipita vermifera MAFF 305830]|uniref:Uncharacterized protein n=1 Tax=Serendipita vermifera MAFF 305830 TaxID=933852 RepID=A0A0C2WDY2_SERVB|nr:hypothetical protein M408DRAFT_26929 [Serendipita vermifera MAFF 305830]